MERQTEEKPRREYDPPQIVHTEKIETRAVVCIKADVFCDSQGGPIQS